ncbi:HPr-like protein Crh [Alicyclobacillus contaminans]|uniref:HPr family phosphocarrier protein n=1 Tax=Alicyclobacillus contaminans TaxID=392016 RepID=UPI000417C63C|nr:HPr family phosphocarrier protein [Alicyclobacillus contaminans]GMA50669.1 HPr-like protein Crh [Alicyclobacillus contaminans]
MYEKQVVVKLKQGLHARPAAEFVKLANSFRSQITVEKGDKSVDAKSILGLMSLAVSPGLEVTIRANGSDEQEAVEALTALVSKEE